MSERRILNPQEAIEEIVKLLSQEEPTSERTAWARRLERKLRQNGVRMVKIPKAHP